MLIDVNAYIKKNIYLIQVHVPINHVSICFKRGS